MVATKQNWKHAAKRIAFPMLLLTLLTGCATTRGEKSSTIPITGVVAAVPCRDVKPLSYSAAETEAAEDPANEFDTPETIREIRQQNAAIRATCRKD
jgi:hypothetical protein